MTQSMTYTSMQNSTTSPLAITTLYFELSNAGNLSAIETLIHPQATYSSVNQGLFYGLTDIMDMMASFFAQHQRLNWRIDETLKVTDFITEIKFTFEGTDTAGKAVKRSGVERVVVVDGLIRHIEVR